jgi:hypothetical protein
MLHRGLASNWVILLSLLGSLALTSGVQAQECLDYSSYFSWSGLVSIPNWEPHTDVDGNASRIAIAQGSNGLKILDLSDPSQPALVSTWPAYSSFTSVIVDGDIFWCADEVEGLVTAFSIGGDEPLAMEMLDIPAYDLAVVPGLILVAGDDPILRICDRNPEELSMLHEVELAGDGVAVCTNTAGTYAYVACGESGLSIVDLTLGTPATVNVIHTLTNAISVDVFGDILLVGTAVPSSNYGMVSSFDISNPDAPVASDSETFYGHPRTICAQNDLVFVPTTNWPRLYRIGSHGELDLYNQMFLNGYSSGGMCLIGDYIYIPVSEGNTGWQGGLEIIHCHTWTPGRAYDVAEYSDDPVGLAVKDDFAYVADSGMYVVSFDISTGDVFETESTDDYVYTMALDGDYLYLGLEYGYLNVLEIVSPGDMEYVCDAEVGYGDELYDIDVSNGYAYFSAGDYIHILDVSDPTSPSTAGEISIPNGSVYTADIEGDILYVSSENGGFSTISAYNLSPDPTSPTFISELSSLRGNDCEQIKVKDGIAYVATNAGLMVCDFRILSAPVLMDWVLLPGAGYDLALHNDIIYLCGGSQVEAWVIDNHDPLHPYLIGSIAPMGGNSGNPSGIATYGDIILSANCNGLSYSHRECSESVGLPGDEIPGSMQTLRNYPNPFNPQTTIFYSMLSDGPVEISIFDLSGRRIRTLVEEITSAGNHSVIWNGCDDQGQLQSSGLYFTRISTDAGTISAKMVMMK